jgi:hypothetical protein
MIPALLLPLVLAVDSIGVLPGELREDPPIQLWISNDQRFYQGERAKVQVEIQDDGYLLVLQVDPEGYLRVLFPLDPDNDNFARGGKKYEVQGRGGRETFETDARGKGTVYAAVSREPFHFEGFVVGDHWDYAALAPARLSANPESELNELVRRLAQSDFDYDLLTYDVVDHSSYASESYYSGGGYSSSWCCSSYYATPFSFSLSFGYPYRHYYYDPYFYAYYPYYNPFSYYPAYYPYYVPAYYPQYVYPRPYYYHPYGNGYYPYGNWSYRNRYGNVSQPFTRYRFRGGDNFPGYRDRKDNYPGVGHPTYFPPGRGPAARPVRRISDPPGTPLPKGKAKRRLIDDDHRIQNRPVEAHRARPEDRGDRSAGEPRLIRREVEARRSGDNRRIDDSAARGGGSDRGAGNGSRAGGRPDDRGGGPAARPSDRGRGGPPPSSGGRGPDPRSSGGGQPQSNGRSQGGGPPQGGGHPQGGGDHSSGEGGRRHR